MGACLSCLGARRTADGEAADRARLLYDDYPHNAYGTWGGNAVPPPDHGISAEEERRLQTAWDGITQWAGNQIVEIFPSQHRVQNLNNLSQQQAQAHNHQMVYDSEGSSEERADGGRADYADGAAHARALERQHQDILLSMIPGDKSKRSIRIYPRSRPSSRQTDRTNGEVDSKLKEKASGIFVKLNVNLPRAGS